MKRGCKKAQLEIGFGMIFSIILIVAFIVVAIITINVFLGIRCSTEEGRFIQELRRKVDLYHSSAGIGKTDSFTIFGCGFTHVCFYDISQEPNGQYLNFLDDIKVFQGEEEEHNVYFIPRKKSKIDSVRVNWINMEELPNNNNPYCIEKIDDKITIRFDKALDEALVRIS